MKSRREFLKSSLGLAGIIAAGKAPATVVKSLLGARLSGYAGGSKDWTNPYVTDGLVTMWDGEWNAGGGVHNASALKMKNLAGNADMDLFLYGSYVINDNSVQFTGGYGQSAKYSFIGKSGATISRLATVVNASKPGATGWSYEGNVARIAVTYSSPYWYFNFGNNPGNSFVKDTVIADVVVKYDFVWDVSNTRVSLYKNGILVGSMNQSYLASTSYSTAFNAIMANHFRLMVIGNTNDEVNSIPAQGTVYNCAVYDRALTAAEVAHNYSVDKERFNLP